MPIKVIIADDQALFRSALTAILQGYPEVEVAGEACNANEVMDMLTLNATDVLLLDANICGMTNYDLLAWIKARHPMVKVIIMSPAQHQTDVSAAVEKGAHGFISKDADTTRVITAIVNAIINGSRFN